LIRGLSPSIIVDSGYLLSRPFPHTFFQNCAAESAPAVSKHKGMLLSNFQRSLAAVVVGNLIYFALFPLLPPVLRHGITRFGIGKFDWGLLIDFAICTGLYILFGALWSQKKTDRPKTQS
jgi:hypothetical protein